jgi:hypothetical protein
MKKAILSISTIFVATIIGVPKAGALSRVLSCVQQEMAPEELVVFVSDTGSSVKNLGIQSRLMESPKVHQVNEIPSAVDFSTRALFKNDEITLIIKQQVGRSSSGDVGLIGKLYSRNVPEKNFICWFSKQAKNQSPTPFQLSR